jgi:hypothetical protein
MNAFKALLDPQLVERLRCHPIALFCGAGISMDYPSCLPSASALKRTFFDAVINAIPRPGILDDHDIREKLEWVFNDIRFEIFLHLLTEWGGCQRWEESLVFMDSAKPNNCHEAIAKIASSPTPQVVITTNFDNLIEQALKQSSARCSVACRELDFERLKDARLSGLLNSVQLLKIHGSVRDGNDEPAFDSIKGAMLQVANLFRNRFRDVLSKLFADRILIIIGYSLLDQFDVNLILCASPPREVLIVTHGDEIPKSLLDPTIGAGYAEKRMKISLQPLINKFTNKNWITANTQQFLSFLQSIRLGTELKTISLPKNQSEKQLLPAPLKLYKSPASFASLLFRQAGLFEYARRCHTAIRSTGFIY